MGVEVCPIYKAQYKISHLSSIHVVNMSHPRGLKRKHPGEDPPREPPHRPLQERKELLDLTYDKLKKTSVLARQVLMTNIIRDIQREMARDGISVGAFAREPFVPVWSNASYQVSNLDPPPGMDSCNGFMPDVSSRPSTPAVPSLGAYPPGYPNEYDRCLMDVDSARATPFLRADPGALWTDDSDRLSSLNWSSVLKSTSVDAPSGECHLTDDAATATSLHVLMPAVAGTETCFATSSSSQSGSTSPASGSSPTSSEDEIFGDVDLTLYDYDYTPFSPPNVAMAPLSAEELMWSLSNDHKSAEDRDYMASVRT